MGRRWPAVQRSVHSTSRHFVFAERFYRRPNSPPGIHYRAHFDVCESERQFHIAVDSLDGSVSLAVDCETAADLPSDSVFSSLEDVSRFFESGSLGYSPIGPTATLTDWNFAPSIGVLNP